MATLSLKGLVLLSMHSTFAFLQLTVRPPQPYRVEKYRGMFLGQGRSLPHYCLQFSGVCLPFADPLHTLCLPFAYPSPRLEHSGGYADLRVESSAKPPDS